MLVLGVLLSVLIGVSLGLLGGGGSILTVPTIHYVFGVETHAAIASSLAVVGITSVAALVPHARARRVQWRTGLIFGVASMAGAYSAGRVAKHLPAAALLVAFGAMMLVTAIAMLRKRAPASGGVARGGKRAPLPLIIVEGLVVGAVTGLVGAGGGFLVVPALVLLGGLGMAEAVGTSLLVIAMKSFAAFAGSAGDVVLDGGLIGAIAAAAIVGSVIGGALAGRISGDRLQRVFGWFIVVMAVFVLGQELPGLFGHQVDLATDWPWVLGPVLATILLAVTATLRGERARRRLGAASTISLLAIVGLGACASPAQREEAPSTMVDSAEAHRVVAAGGLLLDVRTEAEFGEGHIDGAVNIPVEALAARLAEVPGDRTVVVYCRSGRRSAHAAGILRAAAIRVRDLGPMSAW